MEQAKIACLTLTKLLEAESSSDERSLRDEVSTSWFGLPEG